MKSQKAQLANLIKKAQLGDRAALEKVCREVEQLVHNYFSRRFNDPEVVLDLTQDTYLKLIDNFDKIREPMKFNNYVVKIAFHVMQSYLRTQYVREEIVMRDSYGLTVNNQTSPNVVREEDEVINFDRFDLKAALRMLPEKTQKIFQLQSEGYKYQEIADILDISLSTVKMQLKRNLEKLKEML